MTDTAGLPGVRAYRPGRNNFKQLVLGFLNVFVNTIASYPIN